jgi:hypothetical protein
MSTNLSAGLNAHLSALDTGLTSELQDAAQRRLEQRLSRARPAAAGRRWIGWVTATAATCLVVLALVMMPTRGGVAFATAQQHLRDFSTLTLTIDQRAQGMDLPGIRVRMNRLGDVRTDLGDATSIVVSARQHAMLTLLHGPHKAIRMPLDGAATGKPADNMAWLDAIRRFQGQARPLPGSRMIDGRRTTGWAMDTEGMHIELWADADGLPRAIDINNGQTLSQRFHVAVDAPIDATVFSTAVPAGYKVPDGDDD